MNIKRLDHFTLRTQKLEETLSFFQTVAGLEPGPRPAFPFPGAWLYTNGVAVMHLAVFDADDRALRDYLGDRDGAMGGGSVDHIAFRCAGLPAFEEKLASLGLSYRGRTVPELGEHQVFVMDPNKLQIEFIFNSIETATWAGESAGKSFASSPETAGTHN